MGTEEMPSEPLEGVLSDSSLWTVLEPARGKGQRSGRITGVLRNAALPTLSGHDNRAGHRLYVWVNQPRQFRINVLGRGRWRRRAAHNAAREYGSQAANTAIEPQLPRRIRRIIQVEQDSKARHAGLRPGWRRP